MSAETIPADVLSAAREALAAEFECSVKAFPANPARARRGEMDHTYELKAIVRAILTDRSTRPAETAGCMCRDVAFGSHKVAVPMKLPAHMQAEERARVEAGLSPCITVDACLVEEVSDLWAKGIRTTGCCCGHNKAVGYIGVNKGDIPAMKGLGYVVRENTSRPGAQDGFVPKSIKYGDHPAEPAAPVAEAGEVERRWIGVVPSGLGGPAKLTRLERVAEIWRDQGLSVTEWVPASTLEAERARADAAEQRAADALARAEKAEGTLAEAQGALVDLADWLENDCGAELPHSHIEKQVAIARGAPSHAAREAQPATDGGEA